MRDTAEASFREEIVADGDTGEEISDTSKNLLRSGLITMRHKNVTPSNSRTYIGSSISSAVGIKFFKFSSVCRISRARRFHSDMNYSHN